MTIPNPFAPNARICELGGDPERPQYRPNVNAVAGPGVDIVADLNDRVPLETASFDGIYASYVLEHLRHAKVRGFLAECYRVLRPDGAALMVTANLLEQAKRLVDKELWDDDDVHMVFGGKPDVPNNYHHTGFSPEYVCRLFENAGFRECDVYAHPNCITDMVVIAKK